jgi:thiol-disulfide isomerase/thioredoxin
MTNQMGELAPPLRISEWVQGQPTTLEDLKGKVVVIEVFQVNCPGCFIYGLPEAIELSKSYSIDNVAVLGLATAFEDFDKNNLENLKALVNDRKPIGETLRSLGDQGQLDAEMKIPYKIPFPVAMDLLLKEDHPVNDIKVTDFVRSNVEDFDMYHPKDKAELLRRVREYLDSRSYTPATFELYGLKGTPSTIYVDKKGNLFDTKFGSQGTMKYTVDKLLSE